MTVARIGDLPPSGGLDLVDRWRRRVLLVGDVVAPSRALAFVVDLEHRKMSHKAHGCCTVPVVLAWLEEDAVAGADHLDRTAAPLREADALGDPDRLPVRMRV